MKVISEIQPFGTLIAIGAKKIETRSWATKYRGPLAIHASKAIHYKNHDLRYRVPFSNFIPREYKFPLGSIIAVCTLVHCLKIVYNDNFSKMALLENDQWVKENEYCFGDYTPGRFAWLLEDIQPLEKPIPAKGRLGLWEFDLEGALRNGGK